MAADSRDIVVDSGDTVAEQKVITDLYDMATLQNLESWDDALALLTEQYGTIEDAQKVIGSGFALLDAHGKYKLQNEPFMLVHVMFPQSGDYKNTDGTAAHYAVAHIITKDGRKLILTDGGVGIYRQLEEWALRSGRQGGLLVQGGLRASTYDLPDGTGQGTTYYLAV